MKRKTGILACSISLIFLGILLLLINLKFNIPSSLYGAIWPLFLILLGSEFILGKSLYGEDNSGFNAGIVIFTIIIMAFTTTYFYFVPDISSSIGKGGFFIRNIIDSTLPMNTKEVYKEIEFNNSIKKVNITNKMGSITFNQSSSNKMTVTAKIRYRGERTDISDNSIILAVQNDTVYLRDNIDRHNEDKEIIVDYNIEIPLGENVIIDNGFGSVNSNMYTGKIDVKNKFGSIDIRQTNGDIRISNKYGNIDLKDIRGFLDVENEFGSVNINGSNGVKIVNRYGNIDVTKPGDGNVDIENGFGNVSIRNLPSDFTLDARTQFGSISSNLSLYYNKSITESNAKYTKGSGKYEVVVKNHHGSIEIN